jgi:hypothetical protein
MAKPDTIISLTQDEKTIMGLYGHPSAGKTDFICQGAKDGMKILLLRCDLDHIPARALNSGAEQWIVRDWAEMNNEVLEYIRHDSAEWDWIWLDSATLWQDHGLQELFDGAVAAKPHRGEHGPDKPEYRVNMWRMEQWFRHAIGGVQCNLGIAAHAQMMDDPWPDVGSILMPLIQGRNMPQKFSAMMNFIGYLEVKEGTDGQWRRLHTQLTGEAYGKDQYDAFPTGRLDHPTLSKVASAIEATKVPAKPGRRAGRRGPQGANTRDKAKPGRRGRRAAA